MEKPILKCMYKREGMNIIEESPVWQREANYGIESNNLSHWGIAFFKAMRRIVFVDGFEESMEVLVRRKDFHSLKSG